MDKKRYSRLVKEIKAAVDNPDSPGCAHVRFVVQKKPYTHVQIYYTGDIGERAIIGDGFSKVNWPDEWNAPYGYRRALKRAIRDVMEQLIDWEQSQIQVAPVRQATFADILTIKESQSHIEVTEGNKDGDVTEGAVGEMWVGPEIVDVVFAGAEA